MMLFSQLENANIGRLRPGSNDAWWTSSSMTGWRCSPSIPHARNAIALDTMQQLEQALDAAAGARALVITGAGDRAFVSGGDLKEPVSYTHLTLPTIYSV